MTHLEAGDLFRKLQANKRQEKQTSSSFQIEQFWQEGNAILRSLHSGGFRVQTRRYGQNTDVWTMSDSEGEVSRFEI